MAGVGAPIVWGYARTAYIEGRRHAVTGHRRRPRTDGSPGPGRAPAALLALGVALGSATLAAAPRGAAAQTSGDDPFLSGLSESAPAADVAAPSAETGSAAPAPDVGPQAGPPGTAPTARGLLEPPVEAVLASGIAGRIEDLPRREGERFAAGDLLVRFDCALYEARLAAAQAGALKARRQLANDRQLANLNSIGRLEVGLAEAELARAEAEAGVTAVLVERCRLPAPFDGRVVAWRAEPFETVGEGAPIIEVVAAGPPEVALIVPSRWLSWLAERQPFVFTVDETGSRHVGTVSRVGARVDPASQTVRVTGRLDAAADALIPGMSGTARFDGRPDG